MVRTANLVTIGDRQAFKALAPLFSFPLCLCSRTGRRKVGMVPVPGTATPHFGGRHSPGASSWSPRDLTSSVWGKRAQAASIIVSLPQRTRHPPPILSRVCPRQPFPSHLLLQASPTLLPLHKNLTENPALPENPAPRTQSSGSPPGSRSHTPCSERSRTRSTTP